LVAEVLGKIGIDLVFVDGVFTLLDQLSVINAAFSRTLKCLLPA